MQQGWGGEEEERECDDCKKIFLGFTIFFLIFYIYIKNLYLKKILIKDIIRLSVYLIVCL